MRRRPRKQYGILDDFNEVIRWVWEKPINRKFITRTLPSEYELMMMSAEDAPF